MINIIGSMKALFNEAGRSSADGVIKQIENTLHDGEIGKGALGKYEYESANGEPALRVKAGDDVFRFHKQATDGLNPSSETAVPQQQGHKVTHVYKEGGGRWPVATIVDGQFTKMSAMLKPWFL